MRLPLSSRGAQPQPAERKHNGENHEPVLLHGTLFVYVRRARDLGRSHTIALEPDGQRKAAIKGKLTAGARFVGKKMLNAVRTTNQVRSSVPLLWLNIPCSNSSSLACDRPCQHAQSISVYSILSVLLQKLLTLCSACRAGASPHTLVAVLHRTRPWRTCDFVHYK